MASLLRLLNNRTNMRDDIFHLTQSADRERKREYDAAVKIQSWIRGLQTRHYLRHLHASSVVIQKHWRGFMARSYFRVYVSNLHIRMRVNFYHAMATRVQRMWRGFRVRKYVHNFYARQRYFDALAVKNQIVRYELDEWRHRLDQEACKNEMDERERRLMREARAKHHLLSTKQVAGVFNSPYRPDGCSDMEKRLRQNKPRVGERPLERKQRDPWDGCVDPAPQQLFLQAPTELPPLDPHKLQGPFRDSNEVRRQRYRPLEPTLRVQTSFQSLQKARKILLQKEDAGIVVEEPWLPSVFRRRAYERTMHNSLKFKPLQEEFRDVNPNKWIGNKRFRNVASPVPVFDQLNNTYYQGQVKF